MKTYQGGCHCQKIRFELTSDLARVIECNCSICAKRAHLLHFVPMAQVKFLAGSPEEASGYKFGKNVIRHCFCPTCGVNVFSMGQKEGAPILGVNVRCLDDVDLATLNVTKVDGKSRQI
jgi:hypothetical protein